MPKSHKEDSLSTLANRIFAVMLDDIVMDVTLQAHQEIARGRALCQVCKTYATAAIPVCHVPETSTYLTFHAVHAPTYLPPSRQSTPSASGSASPTKSDGNLLLECLICSRQIASNRYAPHLSSCMGLSTTRRGSSRGTTKSKPPSEEDGSESQEETYSEDGKGGKGKKQHRTDDADFNLKRKRDSPQVTPNKKQKKQAGKGSPVNRVKSSSDSFGSPLQSPSVKTQSKVPSRLRESSVASAVERSPTVSSRSSSPVQMESPGASSSYSFQSPHLAARTPNKTIRQNSASNVDPLRRSPPRPVVDDYLDEGDETGSSTDTDSS
ncbi:unnamed protein product [Mycena citricolor]|uniref:SAGA-associated factor 11 n=1 Tax=Mycena citricolor TaxID=2018698 RepID=A0AAD2Q600_9AGAR|nr:unnamed protein product [Mycena citricolor]